MLELSLNSLIYLFYRLSPFILVCFFVLGSIINSEAKGFMYLVGLICTTVLCYGLVPWLGGSVPDGSDKVMSVACSTLKINGITSETTPMGMIIFSYTLFYLVYPIVRHHLEMDNIPLLLFFPLLILGDIYWNTSHSCFTPRQQFVTLVISGACGLGWGAIIERTNMKGLQYFNIGTGRQRCAQASTGKYKCTTMYQTKDSAFSLGDTMKKYSEEVTDAANKSAEDIKTATGNSLTQLTQLDTQLKADLGQLNEVSDVLRTKVRSYQIDH
jgi:hypothetical protein